MVFCGKPSRGCQMCRTRRIKCDETKPTCLQCVKSRRSCPGYRDEFDLVFRNETKAVEDRAKKAIRKTAQRTDKTGQEPISPLSSIGDMSPTFAKDDSQSSAVMSPCMLLRQDPETMASNRFLSNFVLMPANGSTRGFMDYLVPLLKTVRRGSHIQHAFKACALASLGNTVVSAHTDLLAKAGAEYSKALIATQIAVANENTAKTDATLGAVLLLGMYENITARKMGEFAWGSHIEGAIELVKRRGRKQLRTKNGLLLFIAVRTQLYIHTITSGKAPVMGTDWWMHDAVKNETSANCQRINLKTSELRAEVTKLMSNVSRNPENIESMQVLLRRAQALDQEMVAWMKKIPETWEIKTFCWQDNLPGGDYSKTQVFPGRVDMYSDFWIASVWNMARTTRLIIHSVVVRCAAWICSPVDYRTMPEYATATRVCVEMISDILASVPYHLGWHRSKMQLFRNLDVELSSFACGDEKAEKGLAGYFLTWPLACVIGQDYATDSQRAYIQGRLKHIGDVMGVKYAYILSQLQVRIPSMLIRRDGMMAQPYPNANNFERLIRTARVAPPTAGYSMNPLQQREAMQQDFF